jgi:hypothetical protein
MNSSGKSFSEKCIGLLYNYYHFWHKRAPKGEFHIFYFFIFHPILMQYTLVQLSLVDMLRSYHASLCESMHLYFLPFCSCWEFSHINNLLFILIKNHMRKLQAMFMNWFHCVSLGLHKQYSWTGSIVYLLAYCSFSHLKLCFNATKFEKMINTDIVHQLVPLCISRLMFICLIYNFVLLKQIIWNEN